MSITDRTNEDITLSLEEGIDIYGKGGGHLDPAMLSIDAGYESSFTPSNLVWLMFATDNEPWFKLTYEEAAQVHDRLGRILGLVKP